MKVHWFQVHGSGLARLQCFLDESQKTAELLKSNEILNLPALNR
jgi:hypothetical protein